MSKIDKRFILLDPSHPDAITANDIYYDATVTVKNKLDSVSSGFSVIETPVITLPTDGQTDYNGPIKSSTFNATSMFYGPHNASDWEIAADRNFNNIIESSYNDTINLTSYTPINIQPLTTYYVCVRYRSDYHMSLWSDPISFTTPEAFIRTPIISCTTDDSLYPVFNLTSFNPVGCTDNWQSTEWQIATDPDFDNIIEYHVETNSDNQSTWVITDDILDVNSTYYIRAKYNGDQGHESSWSNSYILNTGLYQIEYTIPPQANEQDTIYIHVTHDNSREFDTSQYTLSGFAARGSLVINGMDVAWTLPDVSQDVTANITLYVIRNSDLIEVTEHLTKSLTIKNVTFVSDTAVVISDFTQYDYNDGWDTTV